MAWVQEGRYMCQAVLDDGPGLPAVHQSQRLDILFILTIF